MSTEPLTATTPASASAPTTGQHRGWTTVEFGSPQLRARLLPGRGGDILDLRRVSDDLPLLGATPWGVRPFGLVSAPSSAGAMAMESWAGGWRSLFPNAGRSSVAGGVELGESGEACLAWYDWEPVRVEDGQAVRLTTRLARVPFVVERTTSVTGSTVQVSETVRNVGGQDVEVMWAQQLMLTAPVVAPAARFDAGATIVRPDTDVVTTASWDDLMPWPRAHGDGTILNLRTIPAADADETRMAYLTDFTRPQLTVTNPELDVSLRLEWDAEVWPYAWYQLEAGHEEDFPWYRSGYFLAIGPASSWPARGVHEAERLSELISFAPGEERTATLSLTVGAA